MSEYYKIPFEPELILARKSHSRCGLEDSIKQFIRLVLLTGFKEFKRAPTFGCSIWDIEYDIFPNESGSKQIIQESLSRSIKKYETRLSNVDVEATIEESSPLMKKVKIQIRGKIKATATPFSHDETFFLCPKSMLK